jgi:hypothetical protein
MSATSTTYTILYDYTAIAEVQIDHTDQARLVIKEMVEFWGNWEKRLRDHNGNYTQCFLHQLGRCILRGGREVVKGGAEGWYPLNGSHGITVLGVWPPDFDDDLVTVEENEP